MSDARQRPPAEDLHADELARLAAHDGDAPRPPGWRLTPAAVVAFVLGDAKLEIAPKFVGRARSSSAAWSRWPPTAA